MKALLKILFAMVIGGSWYFLTQDMEMSLVFGALMAVILLIDVKKTKSSKIQEQYLEKLKANIERNKEIQNEYAKERNTTYKDFRKRG